MKKVFIFIVLMIVVLCGQSQTMLDNVIVEKYHTATAADASAHSGLVVGAVTYRVYVDMNNTNGAQLQGIYSDDNHGLYFKTTTSFYNDLTNGGKYGENVKAAGVYDSYISFGGATSATTVGVYGTSDASASPEPTGAIGFALSGTNSLTAAFNSTTAGAVIDYPATNSVMIYDNNPGGLAVGATVDNRVLIGQFTTDGIFSFSFALLLTDGNNQEAWVASDAVINSNGLQEYANSTLMGLNQPPTITFSSPTTSTTHQPISFSSIANDRVGLDGITGSISQVEYFNNETSLGISSSHSNPYTLSYTPLTTGTLNITAIATDDQGASTRSNQINIVVSNPIPTISITAPSSSPTVTAGSHVTLTASAGDINGSIANVKFYDGATVIATIVSFPYTYDWTTPSTSGIHTITAKATDNDGAIGTSSSKTVTVNLPNTPPTISLSSTATSVNLATGITLTANAADADGTIASIQFFDGVTSLGNASLATTKTIATLSAGSHSYTAVAIDNNGASTTSTPVVVTATNALPTIAIAAIPTVIKVGATSTITASAGDVDGSISKIEFFEGTTSLGIGSPLIINSLSVGLHNITANATDNNGGVTTSNTVAITVSANVAPTVSLSSTSTSVNLATGITLTANAADADGTIASIQFFDGATSLGTATLVTTKTIVSLTAGSHSYTAVIVDDNGASTTSNAIVVIATNAVPTIAIAAIPTVIKVGATSTITATAGDVDGSISKIEFFEGTTSLGIGSPLTINTLSVGLHNITAKATDNNGGVTTSNTVAITVNANIAPTVSLSSTATSVNLATGITLTANAADADGTIASIQFFDGATSLGIATLVTTKTIASLTAGSHSYTAVVVDDNGASTTSNAVVVIATNASPTITISADQTDVKAGTNVMFTSSAGDVDGSISKIEFFEATTSLGIGSSLTLSTLSVGSHVITAKATDNLGAITTSSSITIHVFLDNIYPTVTLLSSATDVNLVTGVILTATASDVDGTIASIEFYEDATSLGTPSLLSVKTISSLTAGIHSYKVIVIDNQGASTTSNVVVVTATNALPTISIVAVPTIINAGATTTLTASAGDADGTVTKIEYFEGSTSLGIGSSISLSTLTIGTHIITAIATDNINGTTTSNTLTIVVNTPPTISITSSTTSVNLATGIILTANAVDADGTIASIQFFDGATSLGTASTSTTKTIASITSGLHSYTAVAIDNNGASTTSTPVVVTATNAVPTIAIAAIPTVIKVGATSTSTFTATAGDVDGTISKIEFFEGTTSLGIGSPLTINTLSVGLHNITAKATDNSGGVTTSNTVAITVKANVAPTVSLSSTATSVNLATGITLTAYAADADGIIASIQFFDGATSLGTASLVTTKTIASLTAGSHSYTAVVVDDNGASTTSNAIVVIATNAVPTIAIAAIPTVIKVGATSTITATAGDVDGSISKIEFFDGTTSLGIGSPLTIDTLSVGLHNITARATDNSGGVTTSNTVAVTVNANVAPTVSLSSTATSVNLATGITLTANAADADGTIASIQFFDGATSLGTASLVTTKTLASLAVGIHSYTVEVVDDKGSSTISTPLVVTATNALPTISIAAIPSVIKVGATSTITATAGDVDGSISKIEFFEGTTSLGIGSPLTINTLLVGQHNITAKATDNSGGVTISNAVTLTVITNILPTISIAVSSNVIKEGASVTLTATVGDVDGYVTKVEFFDGSASLGSISSSPYILVKNFVAGTHVISAIVTDNALATVSTSVTSTIKVNAIPSVVSVHMYAKNVDSTNTDYLNSTSFKVGDHVTLAITVDDASIVDTLDLFDGKTHYKFTKSDLKSAPVYINHVGNVYYFDWTVTAGVTNFDVKATNAISGTSTAVFTSSSSGVQLNPTIVYSTPYVIADQTLPCNASDFIDVPVVKAGAPIANVTGFDIVINYDASKVIPTGKISINNDLINHLYVGNTVSYNNNTGTMNISIYLNGQGSGSFNGVGQVASAQFVKTPNFRSVDSVLFSSSLTESYETAINPQAVATGKVVTFKDNVFNGSLKFWADNSAITSTGPSTVITNGATTTHPDGSGMFTVTATTEDLSISRSIAVSTDVMPVINGYDAYLAALVAVEDPRFTPTAAQIIAMDVNLDGVISAGDVSQINQRTVGIKTSFAQVGAAGKSWLFVDSLSLASAPKYQISTVYPRPDGIGYSKDMVPSVDASYKINPTNACAFSNELAYVGILIGDIDGNYKNITDAQYSSLKSDLVSSNDTKVVFDYANATASKVDGVNYLDVPVVINSDLSVYSLDFALQFDKATLLFSTIINADNAVKTLANVVDNSIRFTSYGVSGLTTGSTLLSVRFQVVSQTTSSSLSSIAAYVNGNAVASEVTFTANQLGNLDKLTVTVYPNPAYSILNVNVSQNSTIQLIDVLGQITNEITDVLAGSTTQINIDNLADGVYSLKVFNDKSFTIVKVVKQ